MLLLLLPFRDVDRLEVRKHMNCTDRSSHMYRKFADITGIRKDFAGILKAFGKGSPCFMSIRGCSESLWNILCILEVNEQIGKCLERILEGFMLFVIRSAA